MGQYGTREDEIDDLLRREVFVDLFTVVRQAHPPSHPKYSLKNVETFFMTREVELQSGGDSILMYEEWLETRDGALAQEIEAYNAEDCDRHCSSATGYSSCGPTRPCGPEPPGGSRDPEIAAETADLQAQLLAALTIPSRGSRVNCSTTTGARQSRSGGRSSTAKAAHPPSSRNSTPRRSAGSSSTVNQCSRRARSHTRSRFRPSSTSCRPVTRCSTRPRSARRGTPIGR